MNGQLARITGQPSALDRQRNACRWFNSLGNGIPKIVERSLDLLRIWLRCGAEQCGDKDAEKHNACHRVGGDVFGAPANHHNPAGRYPRTLQGTVLLFAQLGPEDGRLRSEQRLGARVSIGGRPPNDRSP